MGWVSLHGINSFGNIGKKKRKKKMAEIRSDRHRESNFIRCPTCKIECLIGAEQFHISIIKAKHQPHIREHKMSGPILSLALLLFDKGGSKYGRICAYNKQTLQMLWK